MKQETERWLSMADDDSRAAQMLHREGFHSHSVFYSHLTVEKMLKALLLEFTDFAVPPYTHNLRYLSQLSGISMPDPMQEFLAILSPHSIAARYPDRRDTYTEDFAREMLGRSMEVITWSRQLLR